MLNLTLLSSLIRRCCGRNVHYVICDNVDTNSQEWVYRPTHTETVEVVYSHGSIVSTELLHTLSRTLSLGLGIIRLIPGRQTRMGFSRTNQLSHPPPRWLVLLWGHTR